MLRTAHLIRLLTGLACDLQVRCFSEAPTEQASSRTFHRLQSTEEERRKRPVNNILDTAEDELEGKCTPNLQAAAASCIC